ncbi:MAG TPA: HPr family phosphocarrier protein [Elusimicrobiota bacterium]|nr:HPr family phosphocarrier protein [Elusimicrobiota bacterium]
MKENVFVVKNKLGLHARPAALFVQTTHRYVSEIRVIKEEQEVNGKSIMGLLTLAAENGSEIRIIVTGPDEEDLLKALEDLFQRKFDEE